MLRSKSCLEPYATNSYFSMLYPRGSELEVLLIIEELNCLINAERLQGLVILLFESLAHREVSYFLTEGISILNRDIRVNGKGQSDISRIDKVLILLVNHLVQDLRESGSCKQDFSHHHDMLTDDNYSV